MSIQILGLRDYFDTKEGKNKKKEWGFSQDWRAPNIGYLFANLDAIVERIPVEERYNMYFTEAECFEESGRKLQQQTAIPFDIDGIDISEQDNVISVFLQTLKLEFSKTVIVFSGNGLQFHVGLVKPIQSDEYFEKNREFYRALVDLIDMELKKAGLKGHADPSVFSPARLMRLPGTLNKKPGKEERMARLIQGNIENIDFDMHKLSGIPLVLVKDQINSKILGTLLNPDTKTIEEECEFLKWAKVSPNEITEPEWYAMLSVVSRFENGTVLAHEYSKGHKGYTEGETNNKIKQAQAASGPRTCGNINALWGRCMECKHFGTKLKSPIMITGPSHIATLKSGFHAVKQDANGNIVPGKPCHEDLRRFFDQESPYIMVEDLGEVYRWNGKHWDSCPTSNLHAFANDNFKPKTLSREWVEFEKLVKVKNIKNLDWIQYSTAGKLNFQNGVLDIKTRAFAPHSTEYGFRSVLPYNYDPLAKAPLYEKFLDEIMDGQNDKVQVLKEFCGYAISNDSPWAHKALVLLGSGANGKSVFINVLRRVVGKENYSSISVEDMKRPEYAFNMEGKLFNASEETGKYSFTNNPAFKNLVTGGELSIKPLYKQPVELVNSAKFVFATNEMPKTDDTTDGLTRRLLVVRFDKKFEEEKADSHLLEKLVEEAPGILNLFLAGYSALSNRGRFIETEESKREVFNFNLENNSLLAWFRSNVIETNDLRDELAVPVGRLYSNYKDYCLASGGKFVSLISFGIGIKKYVSDYKTRKFYTEKAKFVRGIKLRDEKESF